MKRHRINWNNKTCIYGKYTRICILKRGLSHVCRYTLNPTDQPVLVPYILEKRLTYKEVTFIEFNVFSPKKNWVNLAKTFIVVAIFSGLPLP